MGDRLFNLVLTIIKTQLFLLGANTGGGRPRDAQSPQGQPLSSVFRSLTRLGLILLLLQYVVEFLFHMARLFYFTDENNEKL